MEQRKAWKENLGAAAVLAVILLAFAGCMRVAAWVGPDHNKPPCTIADVNAGVDRCQPDYPPELPSGTD